MGEDPSRERAQRVRGSGRKPGAKLCISGRVNSSKVEHRAHAARGQFRSAAHAERGQPAQLVAHGLARSARDQTGVGLGPIPRASTARNNRALRMGAARHRAAADAREADADIAVDHGPATSDVSDYGPTRTRASHRSRRSHRAAASASAGRRATCRVARNSRAAAKRRRRASSCSSRKTTSTPPASRSWPSRAARDPPVPQSL